LLKKPPDKKVSELLNLEISMIIVLKLKNFVNIRELIRKEILLRGEDWTKKKKVDMKRKIESVKKNDGEVMKVWYDKINGSRSEDFNCKCGAQEIEDYSNIDKSCSVAETNSMHLDGSVKQRQIVENRPFLVSSRIYFGSETNYLN
jgi:hypothetical protein